MLNSPQQILLYLAFGLLIATCLYSFFVFRVQAGYQSLASITPDLQQQLFDRGQRKELQALTDLGFKPMGVIGASLGLATATNKFLFVNPAFPVVAALSQTKHGQLATTLLSDDLHGRFIVTTNFDYFDKDLDEVEIFLQVDPIANIDQIVRAHLSALEVWEDDGFLPAQPTSLNECKEQAQRFLKHRVTLNSFRNARLLVPIGIILSHVGIAFVVGTTYFLLESTDFELSIKSAGILFSSLSCLFSCHFFLKLVKAPSKGKGTAPKARRITYRFGVPKNSQGIIRREFHNQAWKKRSGKYRRVIKWVGLLGLVALLIWQPLVTLALCYLLMATPLKRNLPFRCSILFNDTHLARQRDHFLGSSNLLSYDLTKQELRYEDIDYLRLEHGVADSVRIVVEHAYNPPPQFGFESPKGVKRGGKLVIIDSLWGFEETAVQELFQQLREKWKSRQKALELDRQRSCHEVGHAIS